jgi:hypothetical protein
MVRKTFEDSANGIDVCADVHYSIRQLLRGGEGIGMTCGIREGIGIAAAEVDKFDITIDAGKEDIVWLQVEMEHLMTVEITDSIQQLTDELVGILLFSEIIGMGGQVLRKTLPIDILHQDAVTIERDIADKIGVLQSIACFKLLAKSLLIADVTCIFWLQPFQEMEFAIELYAVCFAGGTFYL